MEVNLHEAEIADIDAESERLKALILEEIKRRAQACEEARRVDLTKANASPTSP